MTKYNIQYFDLDRETYLYMQSYVLSLNAKQNPQDIPFSNQILPNYPEYRYAYYTRRVFLQVYNEI